MIGRRTPSPELALEARGRGSLRANGGRTWIVAAVIVGSLVATPAAAIASDGLPEGSETPLTATGIVGSLADAGYTQGNVPRMRADGDSAIANRVVDVPRDGDEPMRVGSLEVSLPDAAGQTAQRLDGNTAAYRDGDSATVIQPTATRETQVLRVTNDPQSAREFVVDVASQGDLAINAQGGIDITRDGQLVNEIKPPRATLNGTALATRFVIDGTQVKQVTDVPEDARGTLVLDHWFGSYLGCITGIGVPIGAAIVFVDVVGTAAIWVWVTRKVVTYRPGGPPGVGTLVTMVLKRYGQAVYNSCRRYMNS